MLRRASILVVVGGLGLAVIGTADAGTHRQRSRALDRFEIQSLDGGGNNLANPDQGKVGTRYARVARARYADGIAKPVGGPNGRVVSNRIFNDSNQNLFSESRVTQWGFVWGQFLDHTFGLRDAPPPERSTDRSSNIPLDPKDALEDFTTVNTDMPFTRSNASEGTGVDNPREQTNTVSSYIDAWVVYGGTQDRLEWLRDGPLDGTLRNNKASLFLPDGLLPRRDARGDPTTAPAMEIDGALRRNPDSAVVAGDIRANENLALQATHTLFAREHNRIVAKLPDSLTSEQKFQIARRVVIAEQQFITYNEFLPALGVRLPRYRGYDSDVDASLTNEFATVGYRGHSMIHGEFELTTQRSRYPRQQLDKFTAAGIEVVPEGDEVELVIPLNVAFFHPDLLGQLQLGPMLQGIGLEAQYKNDEQIDNQLRSVLFQIPVPGNAGCLDGPELPECFRSVVDLGAIDIERGRDHGMPTYNELRRAYGLAPKRSFTAITGEATDKFGADPKLTKGKEINDPDSLGFIKLLDNDGKVIPPDSDEAESSAVTGLRRTTLAARLKAIYTDVDKLDPFVGMVSESHVPGTEFGELQLAIWAKQFRALRDGDRFFFLNDPGLSMIRRQFGIDFRNTLSELIVANTDIPADDLADNVFLVADEEPEEPPAEPSADPSASLGPSGNGKPALPTAPAGLAPSRSPRRGRRRAG